MKAHKLSLVCLFILISIAYGHCKPLLTIAQVSYHLKEDNPFILSGYRRPLPTFRACFQSIWSLHNESINIWTHLTGCVIILFFIYHDFYARSIFPPHARLSCRVIYALSSVGSALLFALSSLHHVLRAHKDFKVFNQCIRLDFVGALVCFTAYPIVYVWFSYVEGKHAMGLRNLWMLVFVLYMPFLSRQFIRLLSRRYLHQFYLVLCLAVYLFFASLVWLLSTWILVNFDKLALGSEIFSRHYHCLIAIGWFVLGVILDVAKIPERFNPGRFDIYLHSHQLFHICLLACVVHIYQDVYLLVKRRYAMEEHPPHDHLP